MSEEESLDLCCDHCRRVIPDGETFWLDADECNICRECLDKLAPSAVTIGDRH